MFGHGFVYALRNAKSVVYGPHGKKIGTLGNIFMDVSTGDADYVTVHLGPFSARENFVSLEGATMENGHLRVAFEKVLILGAPNVAPFGELRDQDKNLLDRYYSVVNRAA